MVSPDTYYLHNKMEQNIEVAPFCSFFAPFDIFGKNGFLRFFFQKKCYALIFWISPFFMLCLIFFRFSNTSYRNPILDILKCPFSTFQNTFGFFEKNIYIIRISVMRAICSEVIFAFLDVFMNFWELLGQFLRFFGVLLLHPIFRIYLRMFLIPLDEFCFCLYKI